MTNLDVWRGHDALQCGVRGIQYDFKSRIGLLYMPDGDCCDMSGCIAFFEGIDPKVSLISTVAGEVQDTLYYLTKSGWESTPLDLYEPPIKPVVTVAGASLILPLDAQRFAKRERSATATARVVQSQSQPRQ